MGNPLVEMMRGSKQQQGSPMEQLLEDVKSGKADPKDEAMKRIKSLSPIQRLAFMAALPVIERVGRQFGAKDSDIDDFRQAVGGS